MTVPLGEIVMGANGLDLGSDGRERFKQRARSEGHIPRVVSGNRVNRGTKLDGLASLWGLGSEACLARRACGCLGLMESQVGAGLSRMLSNRLRILLHR